MKSNFGTGGSDHVHALYPKTLHIQGIDEPLLLYLSRKSLTMFAKAPYSLSRTSKEVGFIAWPKHR